jgi:hypothetical protein
VTRYRRALLGIAFSLMSVLMAAAPAVAHPFGPPSTAQVSVDGSSITLSWLAAEDDWVALGHHVGAFADQAPSDLTGEQKLQRSPAVRDYLLGRIKVSQGGRPCTGDLEPLEAVLRQGARLTFDCPGPVTDLDITLTALTDLNSAYRTVLRADTPATPGQVLFTASAPTQHVRFSATGGGGPMPVAAVAAGGAVVLAGGLGALFVLRPRRRAVGRS